MPIIEPECPLRPVRPVKFLRKMRGGAQSSLLQVEDGNYYIVKLPGNPQGLEVLFNEAFGAVIMRFLGLPVPDWGVIALADEFIDQNPEMWIETTTSGRKRPEAGLCFGSRLVLTSRDETLYELLPRQWFELISNRDDFIGMLLFDMWSRQSDNRQAVFRQDAQTRSIRATFIDQGDLFGRRRLPQRNSARGPSYLDSNIYRNIDIVNIIPKWEARIRSITPSALDDFGYTSGIPSEWYTPSKVECCRAELIERQRSLGLYIREIERFLEDVNNARDRFDKPRIQDIQIRAIAPRHAGCCLPRTNDEVLP